MSLILYHRLSLIYYLFISGRLNLISLTDFLVLLLLSHYLTFFIFKLNTVRILQYKNPFRTILFFSSSLFCRTKLSDQRLEKHPKSFNFS